MSPFSARLAELLLAALVVTLGVICPQPATAAGWEIIHAQTRTSGGSSSHPSIRYGHACAIAGGKLLTTHGYFYDRERSNATWLSDTWSMNTHSPYTWEKLSDHYPQALAHKAYTTNRPPEAPCGRFGHATAMVNETLLMYGGHDGGFSRTNRQDYQPNHDFAEMWSFNLTNRQWVRQPVASDQGEGPGKRYLLAAAAVQGRFVLYGGLGEGQGDVWAYAPDRRTWTRLAAEVSVEKGGPGRRVGHSLTPWVAAGAVGLVMYGGRSTAADGTNVVHDDAWFFDLKTNAWRRLRPAVAPAQLAPGGDDGLGSGTGDLPPGRLYHASLETSLPLTSGGTNGGKTGGGRGRARVGLVAGGTLTTPGLKCTGDAWAFTLDCAATQIAWARLPDFPAALYDTRGAAVGGVAYVFGGHLCALEHPAVPPYPFWYVNQVLRLDLAGRRELAELLRAGGDGPACELQPGEGPVHDEL
ncbi:hypothetical protein HYH03_018555 [Edaphochlamys debaryana]|uniref:Uncharacterized protein n=1 Tax=Edaphochlamys debaryana TaxID=47281 RepID=A0A835XK09_9CHLO|nr:hypothetical protein HYH03_018555 [Edaphochlamys debaryana]|eukprot:KAG2482510.1 hypothetical protein HYH03_018555 [Edaphochlamys debaryana]